MQNSIYFQILHVLLRPLIRYCLGKSLKIQEFCACAKTLYLEEAAHLLTKDRLKVNTSRLMALTGIHRGEAEKLSFGSESEGSSGKVDILSRVIHSWSHNPQFCSSKGEPRILKCSEEQDEFKELVHSVAKYLHHRTVLFALKKLGKIEETPRGLKLINDGAIITADYLSGMKIVGRDIDNLLNAAERNLTAPKPELHHRRTCFTNIPVDEIPAAREWIREEAAKLHERIRLKLAKLDIGADETLTSNKGVGTVGITSFSYTNETNKNGDK